MAEKTDYTELYERVGKLIGWDFSHLKVEVEGVMPDFYSEVAHQCTPNTLLLDIGTGGGERIAEIADQARLLIGIDASASMIETAHQKHPRHLYGNLRFFQMDCERLLFPGQFFDVVSCRQAPFDAQQVATVLADGGWFLTQQVSEADKFNLKQVFGRGQNYGETDGDAMRQYTKALKLAGLNSVTITEYDVAEYYQTPDDLIFLLKNTPIIPDFGHDEADFKILADFIDAHSTAKGIQTNSKRYIMVARKQM